MMDKRVQNALDNGWVIAPCSCNCGGQYAWMKPRESGAYEMVGCVCHTSLPEPPVVIDLDQDLWESIKDAASKSPWIPHEHYYMNDWVSDIRTFLMRETGT